MTIIRPPRREPRALAIAATPHGVAFAVCDPWELRSAGIERCRATTRRLAIRRIIRREKPTLVTATSGSVLGVARRAAAGLRVPIIPGNIPLPPLDCARDLLHGMAYQAPTRSLQNVVRLALATVLHAGETHRTYAPRHRPTLRRAQ